MGTFQRWPDPDQPIPVEEAQQRVLDEVTALAPEEIPLAEAYGRVLREDVVAPEDVPPSDNSAMDGYAVRSSDVTGATNDRPAALSVRGDISADSDANVIVRGGAAARIMTGAPIPEGADAVVQVEETDAGDSTVRIYRAKKSGANIRRRGEDMRKGDLVARAGTPLNAGELGVLAMVRKKTVSVGPRPSVAILSTGDEIVSGRVPNSNGLALAALVRDAGATPHVFDPVPDDKEATREALQKALKYDVVISSGGVSHGAFDFVKDALDDLGAETKFWQVAMKPGKPVIFSRAGEKLAFGLPGNPVSCIVGFLLFVRPALRKLMGQTSNLFLPTVLARIAAPLSPAGDRRTYFRVRLVAENGELVAHPMQAQGSGVTTSMVGANGLAWLEPGTNTAGPDSRVPVLIFRPIASD